MTAQTPARGAHLVAAGPRSRAGTGWIARVAAGGFHRLIDRIDSGLQLGALEATLPDGTARVLGGRGPGPVAVVELRDWRALMRLATHGSVGWYQAWEAGEWSSPDPVPLFDLFMRNGHTLGGVARARGPWRLAIRALHWLRRNTRRGAARNIEAHYDLGNDFYAAWLGDTMNYSSGWFGGEDLPLDAAQAEKMERLIDRLHLSDGARVLEIGCGWGALAARLADRGARVKAISLSDEQLAWARQHHRAGRIYPPWFVKSDYREVGGRYDAIVSVEMVEAVGREYWPAFLDTVSQRLKAGGRAAVQFISIRDDLFEAYAASADFIQTYIFPGGLLIRTSEFRRLAEARGLEWHDQADFGKDYAETLRLWRQNFDRAVEEGRLPAGFDARFVRLWRYYLMYCEGGFRGGGIDVSQVTLVRA